MKWCDFVARDNEDVELINHLSSCSRFSEGQYRCPYCRRPEFFMDPEEPSRPYKHARKQFFKHAFDAICKLGSKSLRKAIHPHRSGTIRERHSKKRRRPEDDSMPELPSRDVISRNELEASIQRKPRNTVPRQEAELSSIRTHYFEMEGPMPNLFSEQDLSMELVSEPCAELPENRFSYVSTETHARDNRTLDSPMSPISPVTINSESWYNTENFDSPISPANAPSYRPWTNVEETHTTDDADMVDRTTLLSPGYHVDVQRESSQDVGALWTSRRPRSTVRSYPQIRVDTSCSNAKSVEGHHLSSSEGGYARGQNDASQGLNQIPSPLQIEAETRSPVRLVEELRGLFNNFFKLTCAKLCQPPMSAAASALFRSYPSAANMFETSLGALNKVVQGRLPSTIWEVFSIAHLAYSCALANQELDFVHNFPEIYRDLVHWSDAIVHRQEKAGYLQLVEQLFDPGSHCLGTGHMSNAQGPHMGMYNSTGSSAGINGGFGFSTSPTSTPWSVDILPYRPMGQPETLEHEFMNNDRLLNSLRKGITIRLCLQYMTGEQDYTNSD